MVMGCWGRGSTIAEAATNCKKSGGRALDKAILRLIIGDEKPFVDNCGYINYVKNAELINLGNGYKLNQLIKIEQ